MNDSISRKQAIDAVIRRDANCGIDSAEVLQTLPPAQSEIVRCEECVHEMECYGDVIMKSSGFGIVYCPLEYCSEGKRKDG